MATAQKRSSSPKTARPTERRLFAVEKNIKVSDLNLMTAGVMAEKSGNTYTGFDGTQQVNSRYKEPVQDLDDTKGLRETPTTYIEPLAKLARDTFERAKKHRAIHPLEDSTVEGVLQRCYRQLAGLADPSLMEVVQATGVDLSLNLTLLKSEAFCAWAQSILTDNLEAPFDVGPTTIPALSTRMKKEVFEKVKKELFEGENGVPDSEMALIELVRSIKTEVLETEREFALSASTKMYDLMKDQAEEGGLRNAMIDLLQDFSVYPYCVLEGPIPVARVVEEWEGETLMTKTVMGLEYRRRSPFDLFWTSDVTNAQNGTALFLRDRMTKADLLQAAKLKSYISKNVLAAVEHFTRTNIRDWLNPNPEARSANLWHSDEEIEVITMYGRVSAKDLLPYGLAVTDKEFYDCTIKFLGPYCIQVKIHRNPTLLARPVHIASMTRIGNQICGKALAQKLYPIERAYHAALRGLIRNVYYSSGPIGEVDYSRIARWMAEGEIGSFEPYTMMPTDPDVTGGGRPAHYFHNVPNVAQSFIAVMEYFERIADRHSQIPAAFHGEAVGTGVNRTFRGVTLLQGNALKGVQAALNNFGRGIIQPAARYHYYFNMKYHDDPAVKGDAQVNVKDISGMLEKEVKKTQTLETLQIVAQVAQAGAASPAAVAWAAEEVLIAAGVPREKIEAANRAAVQAGGPPALALPGGSGGGQAPGAPAGPQPVEPGGGIATPDLNQG